jgi:hypothetical protein
MKATNCFEIGDDVYYRDFHGIVVGVHSDYTPRGSTHSYTIADIRSMDDTWEIVEWSEKELFELIYECESPHYFVD